MGKFIAYENRGRLIGVDKATINGLEAAIRWAEVEVPKQARKPMSVLAHTLALVNQMYARKMSFGPSDPYQRNPEQAWRPPGQGIRRITGNYYIGWKVRSIGPGAFQLYNDSREAYFIEFGIHTSNRRVRRPVRKLSQIKTLRYAMTTHAYHRVWSDIYIGRGASRKRVIGGFTQNVQSPAGGHTRQERVSAHVARSAITRNARKGKMSSELTRTASGITRTTPNAGGGSFAGRLRGRRLP